MKKIKISFYAVFVAVLLAGCTGKQGDPGPAGANGVANITMTQVTIYPGDWDEYQTDNWDYNTTVYVASSGVCMVYALAPNNLWSALPLLGYSWINDGTLNFNYGNGYDVQLNYYNAGGTPLSSSITFLIGNVPAAIQVKYPNVNWKDAAEVAQIPEVQAALAKAK